MEPTEAKIAYLIVTKAISVTERFVRQHISGVGDQAKFQDTSLGWYLLMEGSYEALYLGNEKPPFVSGDPIRITIEKSSP